MKKLLSILTLCMGLCCVSCYDDSALVERIDALEKNAIASINEQISAIKASITSLEAVDVELKSTIKALEAKDATLQGDIDKLKEADASLETKIRELKTYVDDEISNTEDWATATFATIEKYNEIVKELSALKEIVESNYSTLDKKIDDSIESIKTWVNETLKGYYTSVEVDELLKSLKDDLDALQAKLDNLLRDFTITFDDTEIGILAGGTTSVGYIITGATEKTTVKALGQNGWSAKVTPDGTDKGTITVTAPNPLTEDEIIVLVYDGEFRTIMSSINFVTGVVTPSQTAVELDAEAGTVDITVTSNLNYKVSIPEEAKDWLSVVETKSTKTETITFAYTYNEFTIRKTDVSLIDEAGNTFTNISFIQQGSVTEITITEAGKLLETMGVDFLHKIKSLKVNGPINGTDIKNIRLMSSLKSLDLTNAQIVSGGDAYCQASYGTSLYTSNNVIGREMFYKKELEVIYLPNSITTIGKDAFGWCQNLKEVRMGNEVTLIEDNAFSVCSSLESISLSQNTRRLEHGAFSSSHIKRISLPRNLEYIGPNCFDNCSYLTTITIPECTQAIGERAFNGCFALKEIHVKAQSETLTNIGENLFSYFSSSGTDNSLYEKAVLYIPIGSKAYYYSTDFGRFTHIVEE